MEDEVLRLVDGKWPDPFYATPKVLWEEYVGVISPNAFLLYHVYRYHADGHSGKCWPSISMIAKRLGWSWGRVKEARKELENAGLIDVEDRGKGRVGVITMLRPKPVTRHDRHPVALDTSPVAADDRPVIAADTNNTYIKNNSTTRRSSIYVPLLLSLLDRRPMAHEIRKAKELVERLPGYRILEVFQWAKSRDSPFGAAVHALEKGYPVGPKPRSTHVEGPQWLPPITRPGKNGDY